MSVLKHFFQGPPLCGAVTFDWLDEIQNEPRYYTLYVDELFNELFRSKIVRLEMSVCLLVFFTVKKPENLTAHSSSFKPYATDITCKKIVK